MAAEKVKNADDRVEIKAPNMKVCRVKIRGTTNYVSNNFGAEAAEEMKITQEQGSVDKVPGKAKGKRAPKDFSKGYRDSLHESADDWYGIPVIAFRAAMVRAAQLCGIEMTRAKMCVFVEADGFEEDGKGLVKITKGKPEQFVVHVRNSGGKVDLRSRGRFAPGWEATVSIKFDADFMSQESVVNLLQRAGSQVGIGAGRPFSTMSVGQGWGEFQIVTG